jgi:serine/threonine-protein kinase
VDVDDPIFGRRYRVTERIGTGGMADVYKAKDEVLGRTVAVKVLHHKYAMEDGFVQRFRQEAQAAANLSHPNIVNIYDWGREDDETYYIVMEYVRGTDLKSYIDRHGKAEPRSAANWAIQVCSALAAAHGYGVIHRDIKPHNLVLMHDETVKVMDFGIARAGDTTMTQTGSVLGTAQYVSPEQAQGRTLGPGSDLYSLGIVLYELVTGKLPFEGDSPITVALKQVNEQPRPPRELDPTIPPVLEAIIMQTLKKDPQDRYHSADEMRSDLKRFISGESFPAAAGAPVAQTQVMPQVDGQRGEHFVSGGPREVAEPPGRGRAWIWTAAIVVALVIAGFGIAWGMGLFEDEAYTVPSVVGMTSEEASQTIQTAGLVVGEVTERFDDDVPEGKVVSQDPPAGRTVEASSTVDFVLSSGVELIAVPDLAEMTESEAISAIRAAGLVDLPVQREHSTEVEEGLVIRQLPEAGTEVRPETEVTIVVSSGTELVRVPDITTKSLTEARGELEDAGFTVRVQEQFSETVAKDRVISQSPSGGVSVEAGSQITVTVSKGQDLVEVPDVEDMLEADAVDDLEAEGFEVDIEYSDGSPFDGIVLEQSPIAHASAPRGSTVTILVGRT